jgi:hypothetical protein
MAFTLCPTYHCVLSTRTQTKVHATSTVEASRNNSIAFSVRRLRARDGKLVSKLRKKR